MPELWFRQEWGCEFLSTEEEAFGYEYVQAMLSDEVKPFFE